MAKVIFNKDGGLYRIAQDQAFLDANKNFFEYDYDILDITTEEFNDFKNGVKKIVSHNGSTVTFEIIDYSLDVGPLGNVLNSLYETETELKEDIKEKIEVFNNYLRFNSNKPLATTITSYITYLEGIDTSNLTPLNKTLEKHVSE